MRGIARSDLLRVSVIARLSLASDGVGLIAAVWFLDSVGG